MDDRNVLKVVFMSVRSSVSCGCVIALGAWIAAGCQQGSGEPLERFPVLAEVAKWDPPDPDAPPKGSPVATHGKLSVDGLKLVDAAGDPIQLRGVSSMWLNWDGRGFATDYDGLKWMRDNWNLTVFRAAMGVEEDGGYLADPTTMTGKTERIIQNAIDLGVYVLVDWHDHNAHMHQDDAEKFFAKITEKYGEYPNLIYETFNEPTKVSWTDTLKPYHERMLPVIRKNAPDSVVILGTPQWSQLVDEAAADPIDAENIMYTLHFYSCTHTQWLRDGADAALALGAPLFVTEWGATNADGGVSMKDVCSDEAMLWHEWMNENSISWAAWKLDSCSDTSCFFSGSVPTSGGWTSASLSGHGPFVVERLLAE